MKNQFKLGSFLLALSVVTSGCSNLGVTQENYQSKLSRADTYFDEYVRDNVSSVNDFYALLSNKQQYEKNKKYAIAVANEFCTFPVPHNKADYAAVNKYLENMGSLLALSTSLTGFYPQMHMNLASSRGITINSPRIRNMELVMIENLCPETFQSFEQLKNAHR